MPEGLGTDATGGFAEPPVDKPKLASWYNRGRVPGEMGPAVILGHVNGRGQQGIFANLDKVREGDIIDVERQDGSTIKFKVYRTQTIDKTDFPANEVFADTWSAELRLITCGGTLDRANHRYLSNVIVYASYLP
jgi:LPXTG-site transpeptidase (sortase) family protein